MYTIYMSVHGRKNGTFYVICDFEDCGHMEELKAKTFWDAVDEAKRLGFKPSKDKEGNWKSFCTGYCRMCHMQGAIEIRK